MPFGGGYNSGRPGPDQAAGMKRGPGAPAGGPVGTPPIYQNPNQGMRPNSQLPPQGYQRNPFMPGQQAITPMGGAIKAQMGRRGVGTVPAGYDPYNPNPMAPVDLGQSYGNVGGSGGPMDTGGNAAEALFRERYTGATPGYYQRRRGLMSNRGIGGAGGAGSGGGSAY